MRSAWRGDGRKLRRQSAQRRNARRHGHHFDGAAGKSESSGQSSCGEPNSRFVERREDNAFVFKQLAEIVRLGEGYVLTERCAHCASQKYFRISGARDNVSVLSIEELERASLTGRVFAEGSNKLESMNFSGISNESLIGRALRSPFA